MALDLPCITYMAFYVVSVGVVTSNTRSATHWKLQQENGELMVRPVIEDPVKVASEDPILSILAQNYGFDGAAEIGECSTCDDSETTR